MQFRNSWTLFLMGITFLASGAFALQEQVGETFSLGLLLYLLVGASMTYKALSSFGDQRFVTRAPQSRPESGPNKTRQYIRSLEVGEAYLPSFDNQALQQVENLVRDGAIVAAMELYQQTTGHHAGEARRVIAQIVQKMNEEDAAQEESEESMKGLS